MTVDQILSERGAVYGDYEDVAATSQAIKRCLRNGASWDQLPMVERESLEMIANKLARWVNGRHHPDNAVDVAGYATLCAKDHPNVD